MAIDRGLPCVVPSVEFISPLPGMIILTGSLYELIIICASSGQITRMLWRAAFLLINHSLHQI